MTTERRGRERWGKTRQRARAAWSGGNSYVKRKRTRFQKAQIPMRAAALAYHTLLSIVPIVGLLFWYLSSIPRWEQWREDTRAWILSQLNVASSEVFLEYFERFTTSVQGKSWGYIGVAVLIYTAWNLIHRFGESVDMILETSPYPPTLKHGRWRILTRRLLIMLGLPLALGVSLAVTQWIRRDSILHYATNLNQVGPLLALPLAWGVQITAVFLVYYLVPRHGVPWRQALKAAAIVAPVSEAVRFLFGAYNHYAVSVHKIYGVLAVIPLFILWVQLAWLVLLSGVLLMEFKAPPIREAEPT